MSFFDRFKKTPRNIPATESQAIEPNGGTQAANFKAGLQKQGTENLTTEQIKEKFIKQYILPKLSAEFRNNPVIFNEIYKELSTFYTYNFRSLSQDEFEKLANLMEFGTDTITLHDEFIKSKLGSFSIGKDKNSIISVVSQTTETISHSDNKSQNTTRKFFNDHNIEVGRLSTHNIINSQEQVISNTSTEMYKRDPKNPSLVSHLNKKRIEEKKPEAIDLTYSSDLCDIATLDGAVDSFTKHNKELIEGGMYNNSRGNIANLKSQHDKLLSDKINASSYNKEFIKCYPDFFKENPQVSRYSTSAIK